MISMTEEALIAEIADAMDRGQSKAVKELLPQALDAGVEPQRIMDMMITVMNVVGEKYKNREILVPEMLVAARAMNAGLEILKPHLAGSAAAGQAVAVIGTVEGDYHDIGKNLVRMMVEGKGIEVIDAGVNVAPERFVELIREHDAKLVLISALLTTTMPAIAKTVEAITEAGLRDRVKIMIGGAPVTPEVAEEVGADAYTPDAAACANRAVELLKAADLLSPER